MAATDDSEKWADAPEQPKEQPKKAATAKVEPQPLLFKEVNELRRVDRNPPEDENAKYKESPIGRLAGNKKFEGMTFFVITVNALYIGYDADYTARFGKPDNLYDADTPIGFKMFENLFCIYFTGEVLIRFAATKTFGLLVEFWFIFDSILVALMVLETWVFAIFSVGGGLSQLSVLRLLRLLKISRMARLMKKVPELMIIIKGLIASFRSVGCTAILQVLILYVWSILFVSEFHTAKHTCTDDDGEKYMCTVDTANGGFFNTGTTGEHTMIEDNGDTIESFFGTMGKSMFALFIYGTILDDVTYCTDAIRGEKSTVYLGLFIVFILISSFTILNMLIGILCEVVSATAESEKAKAAEGGVRDAITELFHKLDLDGSGNISEDEFMHMRDDPAVKEALEDMDIYDRYFNKYCQILFHANDEEENPGEDDEKKPPKKPSCPSIDFETLINMILRLSPGNHINALDFSLLQASIDRTQENLRDRILAIHEKIHQAAEKSGTTLPQKSRALTDVSVQDEDAGGFAKAEPEPLAPSNDSNDLRGAASSADYQYTLEMFMRTSSHQIIEELERRLGVSGLEAGRTSPKKDGTQSQEAFHSLGVPDSGT